MFNHRVRAQLAQAAVRFHALFPAIELRLETATRAEGLRLLARGETDLHCGGIDGGERRPTSCAANASST